MWYKEPNLTRKVQRNPLWELRMRIFLRKKSVFGGKKPSPLQGSCFCNLSCSLTVEEKVPCTFLITTCFFLVCKKYKNKSMVYKNYSVEFETTYLKKVQNHTTWHFFILALIFINIEDSSTWVLILNRFLNSSFLSQHWMKNKNLHTIGK